VNVCAPSLMTPTFELVETTPRPSPALRTAVIGTEALHRQISLAGEIAEECRARLPAVDAIDDGRVGDRLRAHVEGYVDAEAMLRWMREVKWPHAPDLEWAKRIRAKAWRRLQRAARRLKPVPHPPPTGSPATPTRREPLLSPVGHSGAILPLAYWPRQRWLELYALLKQLKPKVRPTRPAFEARGHADLWDWVDAQTSYSPTRDANPWKSFVAPGVSADLARSMLPAWVGIMGCAPVEAETAAYALEEIGMARLMDELRTKWDEALKSDAPRVARAALTLWPAHGSWWGLVVQLTEWRRGIVAQHDGGR
jgi:hypothetical protein